MYANFLLLTGDLQPLYINRRCLRIVLYIYIYQYIYFDA